MRTKKTLWSGEAKIGIVEEEGGYQAKKMFISQSKKNEFPTVTGWMETWRPLYYKTQEPPPHKAPQTRSPPKKKKRKTGPQHQPPPKQPHRTPGPLPLLQEGPFTRKPHAKTRDRGRKKSGQKATAEKIWGVQSYQSRYVTTRSEEKQKVRDT